MHTSVRPTEPERVKPRGLQRSPAVLLDPERSAALSENLLTEILALQSAEQATTWATVALKHKNSLTAANAKQVEDAFDRRLLALAPLEQTTNDTTAVPVIPAQERSRRTA